MPTDEVDRPAQHRTAQSEAFYEEAQDLIPGGVNSPARAFEGSVGGEPLFIKEAEGATLTDADGNEYLD